MGGGQVHLRKFRKVKCNMRSLNESNFEIYRHDLFISLINKDAIN